MGAGHCHAGARRCKHADNASAYPTTELSPSGSDILSRPRVWSRSGYVGARQGVRADESPDFNALEKDLGAKEGNLTASEADYALKTSHGACEAGL